MCPGGSCSQPASVTLVERGSDGRANDGMMSGVASFVPEMPVPCVDECSRSGVRGVCDATSVLGDSLPETCEVPGALPADVTSDLLGSGPSAFGGRGILVSERVQKHVNPYSGDVCVHCPFQLNFKMGSKG